MSGAPETRLTRVFQRLRQEDKKALVIYLTAGDPDVEGRPGGENEQESEGAAHEAKLPGDDTRALSSYAGLPGSQQPGEGPVTARCRGVSPSPVRHLRPFPGFYWLSRDAPQGMLPAFH